MPLVLDVILEAMVAAAEHPLALMQEGAVALEVKKALLGHRLTLREGAKGTGDDWLVLKEGQGYKASVVDQYLDGANKPDLRIQEPFRAAFELKVFGEFGSKAHFEKGPLPTKVGDSKNQSSFLWDLKAVEDGQSVAALLVCGARQYDTARGEPWDNRGNNAELVLSDILPQRNILTGQIASYPVTYQGRQWVARGRLASTPSLTEYARRDRPRRAPEARVVLAFYPSDSTAEELMVNNDAD